MLAHVRLAVKELIEKLETDDRSGFFLFKILRAHILPLTNCAFNKSGDKFITGSYDRTCKVSMLPMAQTLLRGFAGVEHHNRR
jgi:dynein assembly factor with WDR repeat domains 1